MMPMNPRIPGTEPLQIRSSLSVRGDRHGRWVRRGGWSVAARTPRTGRLVGGIAFLCLGAGSLTLAPPSAAEDFNWTGTCNTNWYGCCTIDGSQHNNWDKPPGTPPDCPPFPDAGATVDLGTGNFVFLNGGGDPPVIGTLLSEGSAFEQYSPLTVTGDILFDGPYSMMSQALAVGPLMRVYGLLRWRGGAMSGPGITEALGGILFDGFGMPSLNGRTMNSTGDVFWTGTGHLDLAATAVFENQGTFEIQNDRTVFGTAGGGTFWNRNVVTKNASAGQTTFASSVTLDNDGVFNINTGSVTIEGGGTCTGIYHLEPGTMIQFNMGDEYVFDEGGDFTGSGLVVVRSQHPVVLTAATSVDIENLQFYGGIIDNSGTFDIDHLDVGPPFGGTLRGPGTTTVAASTELNGFTFTVSEQKVDLGLSTAWGAGDIIISGGGELRNGAVFVSQGTADDILFQGTSGTLTNPLESIMTLSRTLVISGPDQVDNGTIANSGALTLSGSETSFIENGTKVQNSGLFLVQNGEVRITTGSTYTQTAGTTRVDAGATLWIQTVGTFNGGTIEGGGTIKINNLVSNGARVEPGASPGLLTVSGNYAQAAASALEIELAGLSPGTEHDVLDISGTATLDGTLELVLLDPFIPADADTFAVLTAGSIQGDFSDVVLVDFPPGVQATVQTRATEVVVTIANVVGVESVDGSGESDEWESRLGTGGFSLHPNPAASGRVEAIFRLSAGNTPARLAVYDPSGRQVRTLASGISGPGIVRVEWDGRDAQGGSVGSGVYFLRLTAGAGLDQVRRVAIVR